MPSPPPLNLQDSETTPSNRAPLQEIFSSIQGEGIHVGKRQIFVRFAHCHLKCAYCDTPMTSETGKCHLETKPGSGAMAYLENPMAPAEVFAAIQRLLPQAKHHSVSFTGGEPLLYHRFLKALLPQVKPHCPTYLETSGTQPAFLQEILPWVDIIAMDIKLPSATGEADQYENHRAFYQMARSHPAAELFIKLIFTPETTAEELEAVHSIVTDRTIPLILQPMTSLADRKVHISPAELFRVEQALSRYFEDVRIIPQTHKMLQVL